MWKFAEPPNVATFASRKIVFGGDWIYYVCHHIDDGAWEFQPHSGMCTEAEMAVVALKTIIEIDPSVEELSDLPYGWCAWRENKNAPWQKQPME